MNVEDQIFELEREVESIKTSFAQSAVTMDVYTVEDYFETSPNIITWNANGHLEPMKYPNLESLTGITSDAQGNHTGYGRERFVVTFDCSSGINTFATLELTPIGEDIIPPVWINRVPYSGGAKWIIIVWAQGDYDDQRNFIWRPNRFNIAVQSAAPGTLGVKMIWE